ncbi:MAG: permease [Salinivirgaceae bacterium]|nr:permease [Salinivirgaceae bacterium]
MQYLLAITALLVIISFIVDRKKTIQGIHKGLIQFFRILPTLLSVIIIISVVLFFVSDKLLIEYLGKEAGLGAYISAATIGSVSLLPGFIAYPLAGILVQSGVSYSVIAVFITTLMMVGILTIPIEVRYFGLKTTIIRNVLSFFGAIIVGTLMAFTYYLM